MYDIAVIGAGPAGLAAASRAVEKGAKTALIEKKHLGGTCLNYGCVPTKYLIRNIGLLNSAKKAAGFSGFENTRLDYGLLRADMIKTVTEIRKGAESSVRRNGIDLVSGAAKLKDKNTVLVGDQQVRAKNIILAVGTKPADSGQNISGVLNGAMIVSSDEALYADKIPAKTVIIGGGFVGVEFAYIFSCLGSEVSLIEKQSRILAGWDDDLVKELSGELQREGIKIYEDCVAASIKDTGGGVVEVIVEGAVNAVLETGAVISCLNRFADISPLGLSEAGVKTENGSVWTDSRLRTTAENIFCAGDARSGSKRLAYTASEEGVLAAENALGGCLSLEDYSVPYVLFAKPEIGSVGALESELKSASADYKKGVAHFAANPAASIAKHRRGWVKVLTQSGKITGVQALGSDIGEIINTAAVMIKMGVRAESVNTGLCIHPCFGETLFEAIKKAR